MMKLRKGFDLEAMMKERRLCFDMEQLLEVQNPGKSFALTNKLTKENPMIMDDEYVESIIAQLYELGSGQLFVDYALCDLDYARSQGHRTSNAEDAQLTRLIVFIRERQKLLSFFVVFLIFFLNFFISEVFRHIESVN